MGKPCITEDKCYFIGAKKKVIGWLIASGAGLLLSVAGIVYASGATKQDIDHQKDNITKIEERLKKVDDKIDAQSDKLSIIAIDIAVIKQQMEQKDKRDAKKNQESVIVKH